MKSMSRFKVYIKYYHLMKNIVELDKLTLCLCYLSIESEQGSSKNTEI